MAYNIHFINKRKSLKVHQINSSAKVSPTDEDTADLVQDANLAMHVISEARKTGVLSLVAAGLSEIPVEVYQINRPDTRRLGYDGFDQDDRGSWWEDVLLTRLDVRANRISTISDDIRLLNHLVYLDLEDNTIDSVPDSMGELRLLEHLNLSGNRVSSLPDSIGSLGRLQQLLLGHNLLKSLPREFCRLLSLEVLDLSNNDFTVLPEFLGNFIKLKQLSAASNQIKVLPASISRLEALAFIDVSKNKLTEFLNTLESPVEVLRLNINWLTEFPVYRLTPSLKEIYIDNNSIASLSTSQLAFVPNVTVMSLSKNDIFELPNEIIELHGLVHLDVSFNNLQSIPYSLGNMDALQTLCVEGNPFRSINRSAITSGTDVLKRYLRTRTNREDAHTTPCYRQVPEEVTQTNSNNDIRVGSIDAQELNCSGTIELSNRSLKAIPENYFEMLRSKQIRAVVLANNLLAEFPLGLVPYASTIVRLDVSCNRMLELPNIFEGFVSLIHLNVSDNCLRGLPDSIGALKRCLESLELARNPFGMQLPLVVFNLSCLQYLNASGCAIAAVNVSGFMKLSSLRELDLSSNEIEVVPPAFGLCQHIKTIRLDKNKIRHPGLSTALPHGTEVVLEYLRSQIQ